MDADKLKRLVAAYEEAISEYGDDDIDTIHAAMSVDVPDAAPLEVSEAAVLCAERAYERAKQQDKVFSEWATEQRKFGRPESELTFGNCIRELNLWRPNETH